MYDRKTLQTDFESVFYTKSSRLTEYLRRKGVVNGFIGKSGTITKDSEINIIRVSYRLFY